MPSVFPSRGTVDIAVVPGLWASGITQSGRLSGNDFRGDVRLTVDQTLG